MRGHEDIVRIRRNGDAPSIVHIDTDEGFDRFGAGAHWPHSPDHPQVHVGPSEATHRLDLRFVVGLMVQVNGCDPERVEAVTEACIEAKASRVIGITHRREGKGEFERFPVVKVTDTQGDMAWQES